VHRFAKPVFKLRAIRVFRDETTLAMTPRLWPEIEKALRASRFFILMADPRSAQSEWVQKEVACWLETNGANQILIVWTGGELVWDKLKKDFDWDQTNALPHLLTGVFGGEEPLYLDLRWARTEVQLSRKHPEFAYAVAKLSASIRGRSLDEVFGEDVREQRRSLRLLWAGIIVAIALAVVAWQQRNHAIAETQTAERQRDRALITQSRLLSYLSGQATQVGDFVKGMLLSIEALPGSGPSGNRPYTEEPELSLQSAYRANRECAVLPHGDGAPIGLTLFSPDSSHVLTALGSSIISSESAPARIWDTQTGAHLLALEGAISDTHGLLPKELADKRRVQTGYARHLSHAVFSRDGMRLLTVLWHKTVQVWDVKSGAATVSFGYDNNERIETAVFSPDEAYVITEFTDGDTTMSRNAKAAGKIFRLSDSATGVAVEEINGAEGLKRIAFSPDGARMVTQDKQDRLTLWNARSRQPITILNGHQGEVNSVAFSPDGTQIASASSDMTARLWAAESGKELGVLKGHEDSVSLAIFSPSGHQLLTASSDMTARLWNINPLKSSPVSEFRGHEAAVTGAAFNADGSRIITRSEDKTSRLWNANTGRTVAVFQVDKSGRESSSASMMAQFSSDGLRVLSFSDGLSFPRTSARLWSAETGDKVAELGSADNASFSPDGTRILTVSGEFGARLWDSFEGEPYAILGQPGVRLGSAAFSPDGHLVITVSEDTATLWDARQGASFDSRFTELQADHSGFEALSPDGKFRVQRTYEKKDSNAVQVVEVAGNREVARLEGHQKPVSSMAFSAAGTRILTSSEDGTARIWSATTGKELRALRSSAGGFSMAKWSPDDQRVVTVSDRGGVDLWDPMQGEHIAGLGDHTRFSVWFSADGTRLVTAPFPKVGLTNYPVRIWNAGSGALVSELKGHGDMVESVVFSSNGQRVLTASADKTAKIWDSAGGRRWPPSIATARWRVRNSMVTEPAS
jgi:WD40 repeat protein